MSRRLTSYERTAIVNRLLDHRFNVQRDAFEARRNSLAVACYELLYDQPTRARMKRLPPGWLGEDAEIRVQFGDHSSRYEHLQLPDKRRFQDRHRSGLALKLPPGHKLSIEHERLAGDAEAYKQERAKARAMAEAMVASASTDVALVKAWPEIEPFINRVVVVNLPAAPIEALNRTFDLPVKEAPTKTKRKAA